MAYQETVTTGYGTRVGNSFKGMLTGIIAFVAGTALLWWNEGRAVKTDDANDAAYEATTVLSDINTLDPNVNGKMVLASGTAATQEVLTDDVFGVSANATSLTRKVEYFQWVEHSSSKSKDKLGGSQETTTEYTYEQAWSNEPCNSSNFKDPAYQGKNFVLAHFDDQELLAKNVSFGAYTLPESLVSRIGGDEKFAVNLPSNNIQKLKDKVKAVNVNANVTVNENVVYLGANPASPAVGDVRITFTKVEPSNLVTVWAVSNNNTFSSFVHKNGYKVYELYMGNKTLDECKQAEDDANHFLTWALRLFGILLIFFGLKGLFGLLVTVLKVVPIFSSIANVGVSLVCGIVAFVWSLLIIAIAWIFYRPILAIILLAAAGGLTYFLIKRAKDKKAELAVQGAE